MHAYMDMQTDLYAVFVEWCMEIHAYGVFAVIWRQNRYKPEPALVSRSCDHSWDEAAASIIFSDCAVATHRLPYILFRRHLIHSIWSDRVSAARLDNRGWALYSTAGVARKRRKWQLGCLWLKRLVQRLHENFGRLVDLCSHCNKQKPHRYSPSLPVQHDHPRKDGHVYA